MHDNVLLGGPVWAFATFLVVLAIGFMIYVLFDSLTSKRRAAVAGRLREPLWLYTAIAGAYLVLLVAVQVMRGLQLGAAVVTAATPFAIVLGFVYLLRAVFPKADGSTSGVSPSSDRDAPGADAAEQQPAAASSVDESEADDAWFDDEER